MIKDVLKLLSEGKTIYEIANIMDMEYSAVMGMIEHMVNMGYLKVQERNENEVALCKTCPLFKVCSKKGLKIYSLTDKALKMISQ